MKILGIFVSILFIFAQPVHAYIDPGTGSQLIQIALAAGFGALFFAKDAFAKIKSLISSQKKSTKEPDDE